MKTLSSLSSINTGFTGSSYNFHKKQTVKNKTKNKIRTNLLIIANNEMTNYLKHCTILFNTETPKALAEKQSSVQGITIVNPQITNATRQSMIADREKDVNNSTNNLFNNVVKNNPAIRLSKKIIHKKVLDPERKVTYKSNILLNSMNDELTQSNTKLILNNSHSNNLNTNSTNNINNNNINNNIIHDKENLDRSNNQIHNSILIKKRMIELNHSAKFKNSIRNSSLKEDKKEKIIETFLSEEEKSAKKIQSYFDMLKNYVGKIKKLKLNVNVNTLDDSNPFKSVEKSDFATLSMIECLLDSCKNENKKSFVFDQILDSCKNEGKKSITFDEELFEKLGFKGITFDQKIFAKAKKETEKHSIIHEVEGNKEEETVILQQPPKKKSLKSQFGAEKKNSDPRIHKSNSNDIGLNPFSSSKNLKPVFTEDDDFTNPFRFSDITGEHEDKRVQDDSNFKFFSEKKPKYKTQSKYQMLSLNFIDENYNLQKTPNYEDALSFFKSDKSNKSNTLKFSEDKDLKDVSCIREETEEFTSGEKSKTKKSNINTSASLFNDKFINNIIIEENEKRNKLSNNILDIAMTGKSDSELSKIHKVDSNSGNSVLEQEDKLSLQLISKNNSINSQLSKNSKNSRFSNVSVGSIDEQPHSISRAHSIVSHDGEGFNIGNDNNNTDDEVVNM